MSKFVRNVGLVTAITAASLMSTSVAAQAKKPKSNATIVCPDYKKGSTSIVGQRTGKKVQKALEAYNNDLIDEAIALLKDIDPKQKYDKAFVDNFTGKMLAGKDGQGKNALTYLKGQKK
eukprot:TRINITY_DN90063_c0_g1_i4.p2 TRINITY_DN90063_c0_g1~~TRINITY_DN90063_c0_g1_i4.p2  ORF type:complete len:119 (+),score=11.04 TRINITY_DN90063_c0_g1_i4:211-567(+)